MSKPEVLFICCARNGSKQVPNKNVAVVGGKPLIHHTLDFLAKSTIYSHLVLTTDGDPIAKVCEGKVDYIIDRPSSLAKDESTYHDVLVHGLKDAEQHFGVVYDYIFTFLVTAPLRRESDLIACYQLIQEEDVSNVITAVPANRNPYFNMVEMSGDSPKLIKELGSDVSRRQDAPEVFDMNGSIYAWKREFLMESSNLFTENTRLHTMPSVCGIDVDTNLDLELVDYLISKKGIIGQY